MNHERIIIAQCAVMRAVVRKGFVEIKRLAVNDPPVIVIDYNREKTLRA